jgi:trans-4-hydroxy-L-proline dehydratase
VPTYPELTCHSLEDLQILNSRPKTQYAVPPRRAWRPTTADHPLLARPGDAGQDLSRDVREWIEAYEAGMFTEFMEQRAPGHTVLDDKIYREGMLDANRASPRRSTAWISARSAEAYDKREQLTAMDIACDAVIRFAERHAEAGRTAGGGRARSGPQSAELEKIAASAATCRPTRRAISTRRCRPTGSATWR